VFLCMAGLLFAAVFIDAISPKNVMWISTGLSQ
jgi:hypothetical protein